MNRVYTIKRFSSLQPKVILPGNSRECDPLPIPFVDRPEFRSIRKRIWNVEYSKRVNDTQIKSLSDIDRKRVKQLRKSLMDGYVYYNNPNVLNEETHYLSKYSKDGKYHRFTKDINSKDRFDYIVYPPVPHTDPITGEKYLVSKIVVQNVKDHFNWKDERSYSEEDE